jgi:hypothetical protein
VTLDLQSRSAATRFNRVVEVIDAGAFDEPAVEIALRLVADVAVLHIADLRAAAGPEAQTYREGSACMLEWPRDRNLIDRRVLSIGLAGAIAMHGGPALREREWSTAVRALRVEYGLLDARSVWSQFLLDGRRWWLDHLPPALMGHITREAVFQPLPRSALARRARLRSQA